MTEVKGKGRRRRRIAQLLDHLRNRTRFSEVEEGFEGRKR
jgi:hypothetical protein